MSLLLPRSLFIHIPKTGGSWVRAAVHRAGIRTDEIIPQTMVGAIWTPMMGHALPQSFHIADRFRFAFVRHPLTLYQSYWCFRMLKGWNAENAVDMRCRSDIFIDFVESLLAMFPGGWVTEMYRMYLDQDFLGLDFVGRMERLQDDLVFALSLAGESFHEQELRRTPPKNVAFGLPELQAQCAYTPELRAAVCRSEHVVMEHFGYVEEDTEPRVAHPTHRSTVSMT